MKRIVALWLICIVCCSVFAVGALADDNLLTLEAPAQTAPGSTFTVKIGVVANSDIAAANLEVTFDTDAFEYVSCETGSVITDAGMISADNLHNGVVKATFAGMTPLAESGVLYTLTFKTDSKAQGEHPFYLYTTCLSDVDNNDFPKNSLTATVNVTGQAVSDVTVTPIYTEDGGSVLKADEGSSATGAQVPSSVQAEVSESTNETSDLKKMFNDNKKLIIGIGAVVLVVVIAVVILVVLPKKDKDNQEEEETESILDDEARNLLDLQSDALKNENQEK